MKSKLPAKKDIKTGRLFHRLKVLMSLTLTPFLVFGLTSLDLYARNAPDLDNRTIVLLPFLGLVVLLTLAGALFYKLQDRSKVIKFLLIAYFIAGPLFVLYKPLIKDTSLGVPVQAALVLVVLSVVSVIVYRMLEPKRVVNAFALFLGLVLLIQVPLTLSRSDKDGANENPEVQIDESGSAAERPNIYHLLLDAYQTDMFETTLDDDVKEKLGGFVYYPDNLTAYGKTGMSLASIFSGDIYDIETSKSEYEKRAFNTEESVLYWLKKAGYSTRAYMHGVYPHDLKLFDEVNIHDYTRTLSSKSYLKMFTNLWVYVNAPEGIANRFIDPDFLDEIKSQNALPESLPAVSYDSFQQIMADDGVLKKEGSYTFVHLIIPHNPFVLKSGCEYKEGEETTPEEQSACATLIATTFVDRLKELGKFDDSLVIIQADHGAHFKRKGKELSIVDFTEDGSQNQEYSLSKAKTLLMIKAPGRSSNEPFRTSTSQTSLLDVAPTILDAVGVEYDVEFAGRSLADPNNDSIVRDTFLYYYPNKTSDSGQTTGYFRYRFENSTDIPRYDGFIKIPAH